MEAECSCSRGIGARSTKNSAQEKRTITLPADVVERLIDAYLLSLR